MNQEDRVKKLMLMAEDEPLKVYVGDNDDSIRIFNWWVELVESGDIATTMFPSCYALAPFIQMFQSGSCKLLYGIDDDNKIKIAMWGQPVAFGIAFAGLWVRKSFRGKAGLALTLKLYQVVFQLMNVLFGITREDKLKVHEKLGYKIFGKFPGLWEGKEEAWLVTLTKDDFYKSLGLEGE